MEVARRQSIEQQLEVERQRRQAVQMANAELHQAVATAEDTAEGRVVAERRRADGLAADLTAVRTQSAADARAAEQAAASATADATGLRAQVADLQR